MTEHVRVENNNGILTLTLARPDKKNALTDAMYGKLADSIESVEFDPSARVILIRGEGDMFTAGNDVGEFAAIATGAVQGERHVSRFLQSLAQSSRPLVATRGAGCPAEQISTGPPAGSSTISCSVTNWPLKTSVTPSRVMGCTPPSRSRMDSRRWPSATGPSTKKPSASGPRWANALVARVTPARSGA